MTSEDNWNQFAETSAVKKAADLQGQLDTIAAQNNEMRTDLQRIADVIDQIRGDGAAMDYASQNMDPMAMMGGAPPMGGMPPMGPEMGGAPPMEGEPGAEDMMPPDGEPGMEPPMEGAPEDGGEFSLSDDDVNALLESMGGGEAPMPEEGGTGGGADIMLAKIKELIANENDPAQLKGLGELMSMALDSIPSVPMEGAAEEADSELPPTGIQKSADDGIAEVKDAESAEDATDMKLDDGPKESASTPGQGENGTGGDTLPTIKSLDADLEGEILAAVTSAVEEVLGIDDEPEAEAEEAAEPIPEAEPDVAEGSAEPECEDGECEEEECEEGECDEEDVDDISPDGQEPFEACAKSETFADRYFDHMQKASFEDLISERMPRTESTAPVAKSAMGSTFAPVMMNDEVARIVTGNGKHIKTIDEVVNSSVMNSNVQVNKPDAIAVMGGVRTPPTEADLMEHNNGSRFVWDGKPVANYHDVMAKDRKSTNVYNTRTGF